MQINTLILCLTVGMIVSCKKSPDTKEIARLDSINQARKGDSLIRQAQSILDSLKKESAKWHIKSFVDDFGDGTKNRYVEVRVDGTFSNSATASEFLRVELIMTKSTAGIFLHEYSADRPAQKIIDVANISMKNSNGAVHSLTTASSWSDSGGILIKNFDYAGVKDFDFSEFKKFLIDANGQVKFVIGDKYSSRYNFMVNTEGLECGVKESINLDPNLDLLKQKAPPDNRKGDCWRSGRDR